MIPPLGSMVPLLSTATLIVVVPPKLLVNDPWFVIFGVPTPSVLIGRVLVMSNVCPEPLMKFALLLMESAPPDDAYDAEPEFVKVMLVSDIEPEVPVKVVDELLIEPPPFAVP